MLCHPGNGAIHLFQAFLQAGEAFLQGIVVGGPELFDAVPDGSGCPDGLLQCLDVSGNRVGGQPALSRQQGVGGGGGDGILQRVKVSLDGFLLCVKLFLHARQQLICGGDPDGIERILQSLKLGLELRQLPVVGSLPNGIHVVCLCGVGIRPELADHILDLPGGLRAQVARAVKAGGTVVGIQVRAALVDEVHDVVAPGRELAGHVGVGSGDGLFLVTQGLLQAVEFLAQLFVDGFNGSSLHHVGGSLPDAGYGLPGRLLQGCVVKACQLSCGIGVSDGVLQGLDGIPGGLYLSRHLFIVAHGGGNGFLGGTEGLLQGSQYGVLDGEGFFLGNRLHQQGGLVGCVCGLRVIRRHGQLAGIVGGADPVAQGPDGIGQAAHGCGDPFIAFHAPVDGLHGLRRVGLGLGDGLEGDLQGGGVEVLHVNGQAARRDALGLDVGQLHVADLYLRVLGQLVGGPDVEGEHETLFLPEHGQRIGRVYQQLVDVVLSVCQAQVLVEAVGALRRGAAFDGHALRQLHVGLHGPYAEVRGKRERHGLRLGERIDAEGCLAGRQHAGLRHVARIDLRDPGELVGKGHLRRAHRGEFLVGQGDLGLVGHGLAGLHPEPEELTFLSPQGVHVEVGCDKDGVLGAFAHGVRERMPVAAIGVQQESDALALLVRDPDDAHSGGQRHLGLDTGDIGVVLHQYRHFVLAAGLYLEVLYVQAVVGPCRKCVGGQQHGQCRPLRCQRSQRFRIEYHKTVVLFLGLLFL